MNPPSSTAADHTTSNKHKQHDVEEEEQEGDVALPGFRFRPTDEELVGFYLHRKVNKKPMKIDHLIMQIDIYRYDPWDLPKASNNAGETEWYFFCKRGRKYRNSIRPNRVTGSGFWKATGIDKPVYASGVGAGRQSYHQCIGLKKTLVYYRGCAGKGTKTDWMMHEFRLPVDNSSSPTTTASPTDHKSNPPEAEVWTVCRIFKRNSSYKKYIPQWRENMPSKKHGAATDTGTSRRYGTMDCGSDQESYISFGTSENKPVNASIYYHQDERKPINIVACVDGKNQMQLQDGSQGRGGASSSAATDLFSSAGPPLMQYQAPDPSAAASSSSCFTSDINAMDQFTPENWDELRSVVDLAFGPRHPSSDQS